MPQYETANSRVMAGDEVLVYQQIGEYALLNFTGR
jgi:hypothetical protein